MLKRRDVLKGTVSLLPAMAASRLGWAVDKEPIAATNYGRVRGTRINGVDIYRGVPYAGSVSGKQRFTAPQPPKAWQGIKDTLLPGIPAMQGKGSTFGVNEPEPGEDCLTLTIWTPATDNRARPVMFYNHGGGFVTGSGSSAIQDGANLARDNDVVVVATNHRLGIFGYLYLDEIAGPDFAGSGCNGMRDIVAGLQWVKDNIENFGGDPKNVMIFGESGGGAKTSCLYAMESAAPYFNKASIESGPGIRMTPRDVAAEATERVLAALGLTKNTWQKLYDIPAEKLLELQSTLRLTPAGEGLRGGRLGFPAGALGFSPVVDGVVLKHDPFDPVAPRISRMKPLICGYNRDEYAFFAWQMRDVSAFNLDESGLLERLEKEYPHQHQSLLNTYRNNRPSATPAELYMAIRSAEFAGAGSITIAERKAQQHAAPCYAYRFDYALETKMEGTDMALGAMHALEIPFKFNNPDVGVKGSPAFAGARQEKYRAAKNMSTLWANFARDGVPSLPGGPQWPSYDSVQRATMIIDSQCRVINDPNRPERELWETL